MLLNTGIQFSIIMYAILAGILTGAMFDLYRIIRGSNVNKVIIAIEDILFWILAAMIVFAFLLYTNYAFLGAYVYIFMILSLALLPLYEAQKKNIPQKGNKPNGIFSFFSNTMSIQPDKTGGFLCVIYDLGKEASFGCQ